MDVCPAPTGAAAETLNPRIQGLHPQKTPEPSFRGFDADDRKPYDYFSVKAKLNVQKSQPILGQLNIVGRLAGRELVDNKKHYLSLGLYQHFDYYDSDTISSVSAKTPYKFCTPASFGAGFIYKRKLLKRWDIDGYAHLNGILLGGALSDYYRVEERNYNLASGIVRKSGLISSIRKISFRHLLLTMSIICLPGKDILTIWIGKIIIRKR